MTIPLIDLEQWVSGDAAQRSALAAQLDLHLRSMGFLVVVNHGVDQEVIDNCRSQARAFFHQPADVKRKVAVGEGAYRGWVGPGLESNAATYGVDTPPDLKETYAYGPVDVPEPRLVDEAPRWFAENVWPATPEGFQAAAEAWWRSARELTDILLDIFGVALGLPDGHLVEASKATTANGALNWYWPRSRQAIEPGGFRIGPHTDFGSVTILHRQPGAGGLQVRGADGEWEDAPVVDGGLLVNTGDMMRQWTNDRWSSNEHRVLPPPASDPAEELISLIFFHEPDHDTVIEPLPTCVSDEHPPLYAPITAGEYLAMKMDALSVS